MKKVSAYLAAVLAALTIGVSEVMAAPTIALPTGFTTSDLITAAWDAVEVPLYAIMGTVLAIAILRRIGRFLKGSPKAV